MSSLEFPDLARNHMGYTEEPTQGWTTLNERYGVIDSHAASEPATKASLRARALRPFSRATQWPSEHLALVKWPRYRYRYRFMSRELDKDSFDDVRLPRSRAADLPMMVAVLDLLRRLRFVRLGYILRARFLHRTECAS